ncbi:RNA-binding domain-containing protein [Annulohypoxylon truncatum]|uniref:RNA-binding domain-containing protein n=1 Tax=Annulohypoxylon truncatum TaxID=327061 RepID=UPI0020072CF1|nr:RNA-binding domain-containing protein [Annulohypoxylon truncatum]KAI1209744.1 RNA-binding domain-containing protein [Annulohypoxylon truncatum]
MDSSRIFVKGLPPNLNEADLRKHFASKGHITDVKLIPHRRIGYVGYKDSREASAAVKYFNRTFVRMSKITVELAKPIADPSLSKAKERRSGLKASTEISRATKQSSESEVTTDNAKKRKRDALDESDPKLQEYLNVMQPAKASASTIHGIGAEPTDEPPAKYAALAVDEGGSDDEYEVVPSRRKKSQTSESMNQSKSVVDGVDNQPHEEAEEAEDPPIEQTLPDAPISTEAATHVPAATDDDWLRLRTNRLLDLVDDEDVVPTAASSANPSSKSPNQEQEQPEVIDATVDEDRDMDDRSQHSEPDEPIAESKDDDIDTVRKTKRLFARNLPYSATEDDLRSYFERYGVVEEVHVPMKDSSNNRGIGFVLFASPDDATKAFQADRSSFQGRILHVLPASAKRDHNLDEFALSKLPLKQQNLIKKRAKAAESRFNWNSLYMSQDAVNASVADRLGISKAELLDPTNSDAAVKQAIAETSTIQDTKAYLVANGVDLNAFKSGPRGDTAILVKNFPYGTSIEEIRALFEEHGQVLKVLMPPTGTIAIVQFAQGPQAKTAFTKLAYRRFKESILFLEKAPKNLFVGTEQQNDASQTSKESSGVQKLSASELLEQDSQEPVESTSLFVKNLHWDTTTQELADEFKHLEGFRSAQVKTKKDPKKPGQVLSMGFGFVSFADKRAAEAALKVMDGHSLRAHKLQVRASHRGRDAAEERRQEDNAKKAANQRTKIVIKNVPFQTNKHDIRTLLSTYGQLKSVRIPKKFNATSKGFAFAEFVSPKEAESAMLALQDTHLLGRRLILEYAEAEAIDPEEEIAKMQKKVGGQASRMALQQLTGGGRKKVNLGGDEDEGEI